MGRHWFTVTAATVVFAIPAWSMPVLAGAKLTVPEVREMLLNSKFKCKTAKGKNYTITFEGTDGDEIPFTFQWSGDSKKYPEGFTVLSNGTFAKSTDHDSWRKFFSDSEDELRIVGPKGRESVCTKTT